MILLYFIHAGDHFWNITGLSSLCVWYLNWKELFLHLENSYSSVKTQLRIPFPDSPLSCTSWNEHLPPLHYFGNKKTTETSNSRSQRETKEAKERICKEWQSGPSSLRTHKNTIIKKGIWELNRHFPSQFSRETEKENNAVIWNQKQKRGCKHRYRKEVLNKRIWCTSLCQKFWKF